MKTLYWLIAIIPFFHACKQGKPKKAVYLSAVKTSYELPGIIDGNTFCFDRGRVFYAAMDSGTGNSVNCFSLKGDSLFWSVQTIYTSIKKGAVTGTGEYIFATLNHAVYLVDSNGKYRVLLLDDRCKMAPVVKGNTFLLQDRGVGLKLFDAQTLQQIWMIDQPGSWTMDQPFLLNNNIIFLNNDSLQSASMETGKLNWAVPVNDSLHKQILYGQHGEQAFVLSTDLQNRHSLSSYDINSGKYLWKQKIDSGINVWQVSMVTANGKMYCKGYNYIAIHDLQNGKLLGKYDCPADISSGLLADTAGNVWFGLQDNSLVKLDQQLKPHMAAVFDYKPEQICLVNDSLYVYSYPRLYLMK